MADSVRIELELDRVYLTKGGAIRVELKFADDSYMTLDVEPESDGHRQILETLTRVMTQALNKIGERGVAIVGMTTMYDDGEQEQ